MHLKLSGKIRAKMSLAVISMLIELYRWFYVVFVLIFILPDFTAIIMEHFGFHTHTKS